MTSKKIGDLNRKNLEAAQQLAQHSINNSQRIVAFQAEMARSFFELSVSHAKAQTEVNTPKELLNLRVKYTQVMAQKVMDSALTVAVINNESRMELARVVSEQITAGSQELMASMQSFFDTLPVQTPNVMVAMQDAMARVQSAFEQMTQISFHAFGGMTERGQKSALKRNK